MTYENPANQPPFTGVPAGGGPVAPMPAPAVQPLWEWVLLGAGVAAILGSFLPWAKVSAPIIGTISASGVDGSDGWITAVLGLLMAGYAGLKLAGRKLPDPAYIAGAGLVLSGIGIWKIADLRSKAPTAWPVVCCPGSGSRTATPGPSRAGRTRR